MTWQDDAVDKPTGEEIAYRAQELKAVMLAQQISLVAITHPALPLLRFHQYLQCEGQDKDIPIVLRDGPEHDEVVFSTRAVLTAASRLRGDVLAHDLMAMSMLVAATRLGDMINSGGHTRRDVPLLEFARHLRNACAHGDRWHFRAGEPRTPAACRHLTLTAALHGQRATWTTVTPRLLVLYLDDLSNYFVPGLVPPPERADSDPQLDNDPPATTREV